jgi:agmatinase
MSLIGQAYNTGLPELTQMIKLGKEAGKFIMTIGGDHSLTPAAFKPWADDDVDILQFDAHSDLRDTYDGSKNSHACAMRRCLELNHKTNLYRFGIRNTSKEEEQYIKKNSHRIFRHTIPENKKLYLTFDVDAFDVSLMPATGTPEPGGYMWQETMHLLDTLIKYNEIVAVDVVEFAPIKGIEAYDFVVAKLCYEILKKVLNSR